jgi:hypothetical protein
MERQHDIKTWIQTGTWIYLLRLQPQQLQSHGTVSWRVCTNNALAVELEVLWYQLDCYQVSHFLVQLKTARLAVELRSISTAFGLLQNKNWTPFQLYLSLSPNPWPTPKRSLNLWLKCNCRLITAEMCLTSFASSYCRNVFSCVLLVP